MENQVEILAGLGVAQSGGARKDEGVTRLGVCPACDSSSDSRAFPVGIQGLR